MSTHAVIARPRGDGFEGRYHHSDGYPSGLGRELWSLVQARGVKWAHRVLLREHTGWSFILDADWSLAPGFVSQTYEYRGDRFERVDFRPRCYCHGERAERGWWVRDMGDDSGCEWAYVLGPHALTVYERTGDTWTPRHHAPWDGVEPDWSRLDEA